MTQTASSSPSTSASTSDTASNLSMFGLSGTAFAITNATAPALFTGPYSQLGLGVSESAGAVTVASYNGATSIPFEVTVDGFTGLTVTSTGSSLTNAALTGGSITGASITGLPTAVNPTDALALGQAESLFADGTVTAVSVADANGFSGTVATPSTTPVITLSTTASGVLKAVGGALETAEPGADYVAPAGLAAALPATTQLYGGTATAGTAQPITVGTGLSLSGTTLTATTTATVSGPASSTQGYVPLWSDTTGTTLAAGLPVGLSGSNTIVETGTAGQVAPAVMPALTGDVTTAAGSVATTVGSIGGQPIALGGALTVAGAYPCTVTLQGPTAVTLPTAGTLATVANITAAQAGAFAIANNLSEGTPATMRGNLGLGTLATQAANAVAITGGSVSGLSALSTAGAAHISAATGVIPQISVQTADWNSSSTGSGMILNTAGASGNSQSQIQAYTAGSSATGTLALNPQGGNVTVGGTLVADAGIIVTSGGLGSAGTIRGQNLSLYSTNIVENVTNATMTLFLNNIGYQYGTTQYRDLQIGDGKGNQIAYFTGSNKGSQFYGGVTVSAVTGVAPAFTIGTADFNGTSTGSGLFATTSGTSGDVSSALQAYTAGGSATGTLALNPGGGNVAIGTVKAALGLHVSSGDGLAPSPGAVPNGTAWFSNPTTGAGLDFGVVSQNGAGWIQSRDVQATNVYPLWLNPLGGAVSIGGALTVNASTTVDGAFQVSGARSTFYSDSETFAVGVGYGAGQGVYWIGASNSTTPDLIFSQVGGAERARLTNAGNLLLGTTTAVATLTVAGSGIAVTSGLSNSLTLNGSATNPTIGSSAGDVSFTSHITSTAGTPSTSSGSISGTDQSGLLTLATGTVTSCTVTFGTAFQVAPKSVVLFPANAAAAAAGTTGAYASAVSTTSFTISGSALGGTKYYYHVF